MKKLNRPRTARVLFALFLLALMFAAPRSTNAQKKGESGNTPPAASTNNQPRPAAGTPSDISAANQAFFNLEVLITGKSPETEMERNRRRTAALLTQDFRRLEQLNSESIAPLSQTASVDYKVLSRATAEIKDRATRIHYYIPLELKNKTGEKIHYEADANKLGSLVSELSHMIESFLGNPVLHVSSPNDRELRSRAGHDLEGIIKLSGTIKKIAKRLSKAGPVASS